MMTSYERDAAGAIGLLAAFADGEPAPGEMERFKQLAQGSSAATGLSPEVYQRVMLRTTDLQSEARKLGSASPQTRSAVFEMAVAVCDADGTTTPAERAWLERLATELAIGPDEARAAIEQGDAIAAAPLAVPIEQTAAAPAPGQAPSATDAELDASIRNHAIVCAAIELLPQGLATAAIIPVQMKMVYGIGKRYGYTLDSGHIKDFAATVGVGVASQVVESFGRRLLGGLVESLAGKVVGKSMGRTIAGVARGGAGAAMTFATTYALGQAARQYYAGGRKLSSIDLRSLFAQNVEKAKGLYEWARPEIEKQASTLNPTRLLTGR